MIPDDICRFIKKQGYVVVATIDKKGYPHTACKGVIAINDDDIFLFDLYYNVTFRNLLRSA